MNPKLTELNTPSHSPFIPDISMTSPDIRVPVSRAGSKSTYAPNQLSALSPIQLRTLSTPTAAYRTVGHETHVTTPISRSRHSFPLQHNPSILPAPQTPPVFQFRADSASPQGGQSGLKSPSGKSTSGKSPSGNRSSAAKHIILQDVTGANFAADR
jgi:hypothetical protein